MDNNTSISFVVPVFNRPAEVEELLDSLAAQPQGGFEVILVEDGSAQRCDHIAAHYSSKLNVTYMYKDNSGPGPSRNAGAERAKGEYCVFLDSDVVLPPGYMDALRQSLAKHPADLFGGPDRAHSSFTPIQKAINYAMTSPLTTGGIRGGSERLDRFLPRSFNMGVRSQAYMAVGGFAHMRFGEDIDLSLRLLGAGFSSRLYPEVWVWHKRRTDLRKFFRQVFNSGIARINLHKRHPGSLRLVHLLPTAFTLGMAGLLLLAALTQWWWWLLPPALFALLIGADASVRNRSLRIGIVSIAASTVQLVGYGLGLLVAWWRQCVLGRGQFAAFERTFYK
ncbi:MAG: glycosyltransferase [Bacteroidales bacterium]|nr:glycosyltransferase [Bacteroidales bacterium]